MAVYSGWSWEMAGLAADVDLSAKQWYFMTTASTAGKVKTATGGSNPVALGVLQNDPKAGEEATVRVLGSTKVIADGATAISYGDFVVSNSAGLAAVVTAASAAAAGIALEALASGCGYIEVMLLPAAITHADNVP